MFWIACLDTAYFVLENDAPAAEKAGFAAQQRALYDTLGFTSPAWDSRVVAAERLATDIYQLADGIAALHPGD